MPEFRCTDRTCGAISTNSLACPECNGNVVAVGTTGSGVSMPIVAVLLLTIVGGGLWWYLSCAQKNSAINAGPTSSTKPPLPAGNGDWKGLVINVWNKSAPCEPIIEIVNPDVINNHKAHFGGFRLHIGGDTFPFAPPKDTFDFMPYDLAEIKSMTIQGRLGQKWKDYPLLFDAIECPKPTPLSPTQLAQQLKNANWAMKRYLSGWTVRKPGDSEGTYSLFIGVPSIIYPNGKVMNGSNWQSYYQLAYRGQTLTPEITMDQFGSISQVRLK